MSDIDISPLAKRLAEENNVDWRGLDGSGDAGKIVERDVLDYLARVMAGEADMDPTPEPLPAGMEAWSDVDPGFGGSDSPWSQGDSPQSGWDSGDEGLLEQDTPLSRGENDRPTPADGTAPAAAGASGRSESDTAPEIAIDNEAFGSDAFGSDSYGDGSYGNDAAAGLTADGGPAPEIDEDIFVFDDEPRTAPPADDPAPGARGSASWADDASGFDTPGASESGNDFGGDDFFAMDNAGVSGSAGSAAASADSGGFSWDEPENPRSETGGHESSLEFGFGAAASETASSANRDTDSAPTPWSEEESPRDQGASAATPWGDGETFGSAGSETSEPDTPWEAAQAFEQPASDSWQDAGISGGQNLFEQPATDSWQDVPTAGAVPEAAGGPSPWEDPERPVSEADEGLGDDPAVAGETASTGRGNAAVDFAEPASNAGVTSAPRADEARAVPSGMRSIAGSGIVLRRDVDLTALWQAQRAVTQELGLNETIAPEAFLLRAAARAGRPWPFTSPADVLTRAVLSDAGILAERLPDAATMPFRELVEACRHIPTVGGNDDTILAVADLSVLEIDEAVLDLGCPVLALGQILPQSQPERFHGIITLSGAVAADAGSRFLGRVVELLSAPVRLVL